MEINEIIENLNNIEKEIKETENIELCKDIYNYLVEFKTEHGISIPFEISKKIDILIEIIHKKCDELTHNKSNVLKSLCKLTNTISNTITYYKKRPRQMLII